MAGTSSAKTRFALLPGHDGKLKHRRDGQGYVRFGNIIEGANL